MKTTYRAMQAIAPGVLELVERTIPKPGPGEVLLQIEACGVCGADVGDIERPVPTLGSPRVPGHEIVGRIVELGSGTPSIWHLGQRVGIGRLGGHCNECSQCRLGRYQLCTDQPVVGVNCDGGYAEMMLARCTGLVAIPEELSSEEAAPILCAGVATFNALRSSGAEPGDLVAVVGIGGLGHMAVQYAKRMGFRVVAVGRNSEVGDVALALGAHVYIDNLAQDPVAELQAMGGAQAIISTIGQSDIVSSLLGALAPRGRLVVLNPSKQQLQLPPNALVSGERSILGSITGTPYESERALRFSVLVNVRPQIELLPMKEAALAYQRIKSGTPQFRLVLVMDAHV